ADQGVMDGAVWWVAGDIWAGLNDQARALLPDLTASVRKIEAANGILKKSAIHQRRRTLLATIRTALEDVDEPLEVVRALLEHHALWVESTQGPDKMSMVSRWKGTEAR
ncbi:MAG: hypothetical protein ACR2L3_04235, partial [Actinomycetota bacterium]